MSNSKELDFNWCQIGGENKTQLFNVWFTTDIDIATNMVILRSCQDVCNYFLYIPSGTFKNVWELL